MKYLIATIAILPLLAGCASFKEAPQLDREFGMASQAAWDKQVLDQKYTRASSSPESMQGITAEEVMDVHNTTYGEAPEDIDIFQFGVEQ